MTEPVYNTSELRIRTRTGWKLVGVPDDPLHVRTRTGWRAYPESAQTVQIRTRTGWRTAVTGS
jgi:hypothetical protein